MSVDSQRNVTVEQVRERLRRVTDPELDRSIVELDYVDEVCIRGDGVTVRFTLPTAWCSPAFAWMMAVDARDEVESLSGVREATVRLREHMHQTEINEGVNGGRSFVEAFPDAEDGVEAVRETLDRKARLARQHVAVEALLDAGVSPEQIVRLTPADVSSVSEATPSGPDADSDRMDPERVRLSIREGSVFVMVEREPLSRYLAKARETVRLSEDDPIFRDPKGEPIAVDSFELVHRRARAAQVNATGQGGVCDALNESRRSKRGGGGGIGVRDD